MAIFDKKKKTEKPADTAAAKKKAPTAKKTTAKKKAPAAKKSTIAEATSTGLLTTDEKLTQFISKVEGLISDISPACEKSAGFAGTIRRDQRRRLKALAEKLGSILD